MVEASKRGEVQEGGSANIISMETQNELWKHLLFLVRGLVVTLWGQQVVAVAANKQAASKGQPERWAIDDGASLGALFIIHD